MSAHSLAILIGFMGGALTVATAVPQAIKVWRDNSGVGVSLFTWTLMLWVYLMWLGYAMRVNDVASFTTNLLSLVTQVALLVGLLRANPPRHGTGYVIGLVAIGLLAYLGGHYLSMSILLVIMLLAIGVRLPQVYDSWLTFRNANPSEVSIPTWTIAMISASAWLVHGLLMPDYTFVITSAGAATLSLLVIVLEKANQSRRVRVAAAR